MTAAAATAVAPVTARADGLGWVLANIATVTGRNLHRLVRVPTLAAFATAQPVMFVLLFTYAFGGAIHPPGVEHYVDYLLPGIFVLAIAFGASQTGVAVADDLASGMIDRFRALPMARAAVLAGRTLADAVRNLFVLGLGGPTATHLWQALAWIGGLLRATVPAAVIRYGHTTAA